MSVIWEVNIPQIITSFLGIIVGGLIGYMSACRISKFNARNSAANSLRASFSRLILIMNLGASAEAEQEEIKNEIRKQFDVVANYRFYVSDRSKVLYDRAWEKYYKKYSDTTVFQSGAWYDGGPDEYNKMVASILRFT